MSYPFLLSLTISDFLLDVWIIGLPVYPVGVYMLYRKGVGELTMLDLDD